jgi:pimeloyl-ACP methyl ester carboxylesterase
MKDFLIHSDIHEIAEQLHQGIKDYKMRIMPDGAHLPSMEKPNLFNHILSEFISSQR